ncbi:APC family permease [Rosenbergiella epipactidis]|uniref:APC family permease n=1 Tax=Rosenbergiella epipactidis TaxID=1544694 RepID=UPI0006646F7C|nr:APC family permease [Rosenbergiella epipactidis]KMV71409.1 putrescine/spermidine ABC transporter [bacteria symbiont BFo2 of Frankliniella occidentalis]KYP94539.1 putrescine/spermidine ABC transporter [bacteria symbiont BFo2 of Frankliniella occidentalis]KYP96434.1 putrescine/spermidine ABC transporter [bacteria symbiont BFo2 of Frankliniella occidentalis]
MTQEVTYKRNLGLWQVVIVGIAYMTPMTVFDTFGIVSGMTSGRVPLAYLLALFAVLLTAFSYGKMVKVFPKAGSAYTYARKTCGNRAGFLVGWASLLDYMLLPMINALLAGIYLKSLFPQVPSWLWIVLFTGLVTWVNSRNIRLLANLNFLFVGAPVLLMAVFVWLVIQGVGHQHGHEAVWTLKPLWNGEPTFLPLVAGAAVLCFSFLGFDAVTTLSDESHQPDRTIPRAVLLTALIGGIIFFVAAWFTQLYFPTNIQFKNPTEAMPEIVLYVGGKFFQSVFLVAILINTFASGLASHASAARLLHIMGRDGIFPIAKFRYIHPRLGSPLYCVLFVGALAMTAVFFNLDTAVSLISFGALVAFTSVNVSVIAYYAIQQKHIKTPSHWLAHLLIPIAGIVCVGVMWLNLDQDAMRLGLVWTAIGVCWIIWYWWTKRELVFSQ